MSARKGYGTVTVRLDEGEEEESEVTREALAGRGGGEKEKEEKRGREAGEEKMVEAGKRGGEKRKGDVPQVSKVWNEIRGGLECLGEYPS